MPMPKATVATITCDQTEYWDWLSVLSEGIRKAAPPGHCAIISVQQNVIQTPADHIEPLD